jgi:hypothetical protein
MLSVVITVVIFHIAKQVQAVEYAMLTAIHSQVEGVSPAQFSVGMR